MVENTIPKTAEIKIRITAESFFLKHFNAILYIANIKTKQIKETKFNLNFSPET